MARITLVVAVGCALTGAAAAQQSTPAFEVASVKPNHSASMSSWTSGRAGSFTATNMTMRNLVIYAYRLRAFQLTGGPSWLDSDRFDIAARIPANAVADNPAMLRTLLATRFKLRTHTETRQDSVFALVVARDGRLGPQMKPSTLDCPSSDAGRGNPCGSTGSVNDASGILTGKGQSTQELANALGNFGLSRMVVDRTGLSGMFDFELRWTPDTSPNAPDKSDAPSLFTALQEQLGLRLEPSRGPVDMLIIDSVERPTPN